MSHESRVPGADTEVGAKARIDEEHAVLRESLDNLRRLTDLPSLISSLQSLRPRLVEHFQSEEAEDGLHKVVSEGASHLLPSVQRVFEEHRQFLADIDRLTGDAKECWEGPMARVLNGVQKLCDHLHEHEILETELLTESVYTDLGDSS